MKKLLVTFLAVALTACSLGEGDAPGQTVERSTPVTIGPPTPRDIHYTLQALGSVESIHHPTISAQTTGQVIKLAASEGNAIQAGQVLVNIDNTLHQIEADKAAAELKRQRVLLQNQANEVKRLHGLATSMAVSQDHLEDQQAQLEMLAAQLVIAEKQREQSQYLESKTRVSAPLTGLISKRYVSIGDYVTPGQPLFDLVAIDTLRARLSFPEHNAADIAIDKTVRLHSAAIPANEAIGTVTSINPLIKSASRALDVTVEFANPGGWLPGSSVDAELLVEERVQVITIPRQAVVQRHNDDVVYVLDGRRAREQTVTLGWEESDWVEVLSGLKLDDWIVIDGAALITNGSLLATVVPES
jgi:RND family efflux transporter MFP subunit